jgi:molybdopterin synthase catalytic subunit
MELELEPGVSVAHLQERLRQVFPRLGEYELMVAVNGKYVGPQDELREGDEVALLPPFSGG